MNTIPFPNNNKPKLDLSDCSKEDLSELVNDLFQQADYACNCYYIGDNLYSALSKFKSLKGKWYVYALNSIDDNMINILMKLYNDQNKEVSLFNILCALASQQNFNKFFITESDKNAFKGFIDDYNNNYSILRTKLIKRRNNWQVHISKEILHRNKFKAIIDLNTKDCFNLLYYAFHTLRKLYKIFTGLNFPLKGHFLHTEQINKFVELLNENGDL